MGHAAEMGCDVLGMAKEDGVDGTCQVTSRYLDSESAAVLYLGLPNQFCPVSNLYLDWTEPILFRDPRWDGSDSG